MTTTTTNQAGSPEQPASIKTSASPSAELVCRRCRKARTDYANEPVLPDCQLHADCWGELVRGLRTIPVIYRRLRPKTPARFAEGKPFAVLLGPCGNGKSVAAAELCEHEAVQNSKMPTWVNVPDLLLKIRGTFGAESGATEESIIRGVSRRELLVLDDFGAEKITDYTVSLLYLVINSRGEQGRPTIITSNLSLDELSQRLDDRIASRLHRYGHVITLAKNNVIARQVEPIAGDVYHEPSFSRERRCAI